MKLKFYFFILFYLIFSTNSFSLPRCEQLYETIYSDQKNTDVFTNSYIDQKTIGIRLLKEWNENKEFILTDSKTKMNFPGWDLVTNKDGYYLVGKITKPYLSDAIKVGDVVKSINNVDLREFGKDLEKKEIMENDLSDLFDEGINIKFELIRYIDGEKKEFTVEHEFGLDEIAEKITDENSIKNTVESFDRPFIDFFINSIKMREIDGEFDVSIDTSFQEIIDDRYDLTRFVWDKLIFDRMYDEKNILENFKYEYCDFSEERWKKLNTVDPGSGLQFNNLVKENKQTKNSHYRIQPHWASLDKYEGFKEDSAKITYYSKSTKTFKNKFNLKAFPFDKQRIKIHLYQSYLDIDQFRASVSSLSQQKINEFKKLNNIEGWNISNVDLQYEFYKDSIETGDKDGISIVLDLDRKSSYYVFKIILPIVLILIVCWSSIWIRPKEIESKLTITIVFLLSLIAYNFVIDSDLPKLEYLTIMDYIILISYVYAAIPNFLGIYTFNIFSKNKKHFLKIDEYSKKFGLLSYLVVVFIIIAWNSVNNINHTNKMLSWFVLN